MALVVCDGGEKILLDKMVETLGGCTAKLFKNDHTPGGADVVGDYTEADFNGYAPIPLNDWGPAFTNFAGDAQTDEKLRVWTQTDAAIVNTIYGYYVVDGGGNLIFAERNPAGPVVMDTPGKTYAVLFRFTARSSTP